MKLVLSLIFVLFAPSLVVADQYGVTKEEAEKAEYRIQCQKGWVPSCFVAMGYSCVRETNPDQHEIICIPPDNEGQSFSVLRTSGKAEWLVTQLTEGKFVPQVIKTENQ